MNKESVITIKNIFETNPNINTDMYNVNYTTNDNAEARANFAEFGLDFVEKGSLNVLVYDWITAFNMLNELSIRGAEFGFTYAEDVPVNKEDFIDINVDTLTTEIKTNQLTDEKVAAFKKMIESFYGRYNHNDYEIDYSNGIAISIYDWEVAFAEINGLGNLEVVFNLNIPNIIKNASSNSDIKLDRNDFIKINVLDVSNDFINTFNS